MLLHKDVSVNNLKALVWSSLVLEDVLYIVESKYTKSNDIEENAEFKYNVANNYSSLEKSAYINKNVDAKNILKTTDDFQSAIDEMINALGINGKLIAI